MQNEAFGLSLNWADQPQKPDGFLCFSSYKFHDETIQQCTKLE